MSAPQQSKPRRTKPSASSDPVCTAFRRYQRADKAMMAATDLADSGWPRKVEELRPEWRAATKGLATTPATTPEGIVIKLRFVLLGMRQGATDYDESIMRSAIADVRRLAQ